MKSIKEFWSELRQRWSNAMPRFFSRICWTCALISGTALAVNTAITAGGGIPHLWWSDIYPYLLGVPAGMAFVAKFTQNYDKHGNPINGHHHHKKHGGLHEEEHETIVEDDNEPFEIQPYDDRPNA